MNSRDSEVVKGILLAKGYNFVEDVKDSDIVLINTCSVRRHAEERVWSQIGRLQRMKVWGKRPVIGIIGCMAQNYKDAIFKRFPSVDIVCGPSSISEIPNMLDTVLMKSHKSVQIKERLRPEAIYHTGFREDKNHAYVVISEGCENFCSYCIVPFVRGKLKHRRSENIIKEIKEAIDKGIDNITLLGQNVNSYSSIVHSPRSTVDFVELLRKISRIKGLKSLSFLTSHPKDIKKELFELMAVSPVIKKSLHLPLQSGSNSILKAMNRGYTAEKYLEIVDQYRSCVYNGQLSTDIIIGFPGETQADFMKTIKLAKKVRFDSAYIFKYSSRPNTAAALMLDDLSESVKETRHRELLELQKEISRQKRKEN